MRRRGPVVAVVALCLFVASCSVDTKTKVSTQDASPRCLSLASRPQQPTPVSIDPSEAAMTNRLAPLPGIPAGRQITSLEHYVAADQYVTENPLIARPLERLATMNRDGFTGGVDVGYQTGADKYGVIILQFRDVKAATDYYRVHLKDLCTLAVVSAPLRGLQGVAYMRDDNLAKAVFVVGNTEVALDICSCVEVQSRLTLAARWAAAVKQQLSPPSL